MDGKQNKLSIALSIIVAALLIGGAIFYISRSGSGVENNSGPPTVSLADQGLALDGLAIKGDPKAKATLLEFGDFQCIACAQYFYTIEPQIEKDLVSTGKANEAFKILTFIDDYAQKSGKGESWQAAQAAMCAADQGKFWEMHDLIYQAEANEVLSKKQNENSGNLTRNFFINAAKDLKVNEAQFTSCFDSQKYTDKINSFMVDAQKAMGASVSTPTIYLIKDEVAQKVENPFDANALEALVNQK